LRNTEMVLEPELVIIISGLPSPSMSLIATEEGTVPVTKFTFGLLEAAEIDCASVLTAVKRATAKTEKPKSPVIIDFFFLIKIVLVVLNNLICTKRIVCVCLPVFSKLKSQRSQKELQTVP
jgi:hypothetical protein